MTRLHFIGGEKGGVGKSVVARLLAQYFIDRTIPFLGFDTDKSHGSLLRFYADFAEPVVIDSYEGLDRIVEAAAEQPGRRIIVDLAAQTHRFLTQWMEDSGLLEISDELGLSLTYWHVVDSGRDSADLLASCSISSVAACRWSSCSTRCAAAISRSSNPRARSPVRRSWERRRSRIRRLQDTTMQKIDAHNTSFWAASNRGGKDGSPLGLLERQRVKNWLFKAYEEIARVDP